MFESRKHWLMLLLTLMLSMGMAGCSLLGEDDDDDDDDLSDTTISRDDDRISRDRERDRSNNPADYNRDGKFDPDRDGIGQRGEEEREKAGIPRNAELVARGEGKDLSYRARDNGTIYVQDLDDNGRLVYSGRMDRDDEFRIDGDTMRFTVNGRSVEPRDGNFSRTSTPHKFRVYFDRE